MNILNLFRKPPQMTGYIYKVDQHRGWGNSINWINYENRRVVGWLDRIPEDGDEVQFEMRSGKIARYRLYNVEQCRDPRDMFFADAMDIGYVGEKPFNKVREVS